MGSPNNKEKKEEKKTMPCKKKYKRIRAKDVGRTGFHYIKIGVKTKKGKRGGVTERIGGLIKYKKKKRKRKRK